MTATNLVPTSQTIGFKLDIVIPSRSSGPSPPETQSRGSMYLNIISNGVAVAVP